MAIPDRLPQAAKYVRPVTFNGQNNGQKPRPSMYIILLVVLTTNKTKKGQEIGQKI